MPGGRHAPISGLTGCHLNVTIHVRTLMPAQVGRRLHEWKSRATSNDLGAKPCAEPFAQCPHHLWWCCTERKSLTRMSEKWRKISGWCEASAALISDPLHWIVLSTVTTPPPRAPCLRSPATSSPQSSLPFLSRFSYTHPAYRASWSLALGRDVEMNWRLDARSHNKGG